MRAQTLTPFQLFGNQGRYVVPMFQRPYVWNREEQWEPLWQDVRTLAERMSKERSAEMREGLPTRFRRGIVLEAPLITLVPSCHSPASSRVGGASVVTAINSVDEFLGFLSDTVPPNIDHWYRGHASDGWDLTAGVFRSPSRENNEVILLKRFMQEARRHIDELPSREWDWVFLAQHHQVPTRLLDWTENPLIGLYFAALEHLDIGNDARTARDGRRWILKPTVMNSKVGFQWTDRNLPMFDLDEELDDYSPFRGVQHQRPPVAALAARNFRRISAQWGTFTVTNGGVALESLQDAHEFLTYIQIPAVAKPDIRRQLARLGLDERTIYPDLFRLGQHLTEVFT